MNISLSGFAPENLVSSRYGFGSLTYFGCFSFGLSKNVYEVIVVHRSL